MARYSNPETRAYARDKAEAIGQAERIIYGEIWDWTVRVAYHRATPTVAVVAFCGLFYLAHVLVGQINL